MMKFKTITNDYTMFYIDCMVPSIYLSLTETHKKIWLQYSLWSITVGKAFSDMLCTFKLMEFRVYSVAGITSTYRIQGDRKDFAYTIGKRPQFLQMNYYWSMCFEISYLHISFYNIEKIKFFNNFLLEL